MIIRIVDLQIQERHIERAKELISEVAPKVRAFNGCLYLELNYDLHKLGHVQTYSRWISEDHLNEYRDSDVFLSFWKNLKPLFEIPARAWSFESREITI